MSKNINVKNISNEPTKKQKTKSDRIKWKKAINKGKNERIFLLCKTEGKSI